MNKHLAFLQNNEALINQYIEAIGKLESTGVVKYLNERAQVDIKDQGENENKSFAEAHRSRGYFQCIHDLLTIKETLIQYQNVTTKNVTATYNAINDLVDRGDITEDEAKILKKTGKFTKEDIYELRQKSESTAK